MASRMQSLKKRYERSTTELNAAEWKPLTPWLVTYSFSGKPQASVLFVDMPWLRIN